MKRIVALILVFCMVLGFAACRIAALEGPAGKQESSAAANNQKTDKNENLTEEEKELVVELLGSGEKAENLTDDEVSNLVDQIVSEGDRGEHSANSEEKDAYNEKGEMTKPFDQIYPELIEQEKVKFSGESILIKMKSNVLTDGLKAAGIGALEEIVPMENASWYEAKLVEGTDAKEALEAVRELKEVLLAEYNYEIQTAALDDYKHFDKDKDEEFKKNGHNKDQWHFHYCGIVDGYDEMEIDGGDSSVIVAVIDSGVDYNHEDLKDNMWVNTKEIPDNGRDDDGNGYVDDYYGIDLVAGEGSGNDTNGHGTHVAGIIAARNNNVGVLGIAYNVKIMSVKAAAHNGTLNQANIAKAVLYAYEMGAEVINMSFGGSACSIAVQDALATAYTRCVLVASAGNSGYPNQVTDFYDPLPSYPAALTYVLGVMSVDETGTESVFTNWDVFPFNGVEYELYAPGENIMSTLPGNKYGYLSGTSMAAPVVSAFAAILRSEFADRDKYPTKFIYGQLASTSEYHATCCNPQLHTVGGMPHNLPQIVNLHDALTKLPKPELNVQEYYVFDDPKYSDKNNGDGVIDAGETIALGLVLRNRWGMSENTLVTIDTISYTSGLADPYFTIKNPTVNYGSVGTYSTQDCGKVYTDELFTGWEDPFLIEVSEDCPNDYRFTLNIKITCENALDEEDDTLYVFGEQPYPITLNENVRSGYILPSIIEEDMVLTKDNLYIIPNATVITEGTTVRVEPGTHIQFWSDDANDPYADSYIAYLLVNGKFLVEGTKEEPVYIYPSQLMDRYGVEIGSSGAGYVSLKYADITNFFYGSNNTGTGNNIDHADHCTFRNNYTSSIYYRYVSGGTVHSSSGSGYVVGHINAKDCVFYKLACGAKKLYGTYDRCIFTQCGLEFLGTNENCVFLGNSMVDQTNPNKHYGSSLNLDTGDAIVTDPDDFTIYYRQETNVTYVLWCANASWAAAKNKMDFMAEYIRAVYGGDFAVPETMEEYHWIEKTVGGGFYVGNRIERNEFVWSDGTPIQPDFLPVFINTSSSDSFYYINTSRDKIEFGSHDYALYEIPGQILPEDITFTEYVVDMDLEAPYQIAPLNTPVQLPVDGFVYESADDSVITVSKTGLVTPVGKGTADVWVWSLDKAVRNRITITVRDYVALEGMTFPQKAVEVAAGDTLASRPILTPANTTRKNVVYTTSNPAVATVDAGGNIIGVSSGTAVITATCEGLTDSVTVTVYNKTTELKITSPAVVAGIADKVVELPDVSVSEEAYVSLVWNVMDPNVATVTDGVIHLRNPGMTTLTVTDVCTGLSSAIQMYVMEENSAKVKAVKGDSCIYVLMDNGELYAWRVSASNAVPTLLAQNVKEMDCIGGSATILFEDNTVGGIYYTSGTFENWGFPVSYFAELDVVGVSGNRNADVFVLTSDGSVYVQGEDNQYGQLGVGSKTSVNTATKIAFNEPVVQVEYTGIATYYLTKSGDLYISGGSLLKAETPQIIARNVTWLDEDGEYFISNGRLAYFYTGATETVYTNVDLTRYEVDDVDTNYIYAKQGGHAYKLSYGSNNQTITNIFENIPNIHMLKASFGGYNFAVTENGMLYGAGKYSISYEGIFAGMGMNTSALQPSEQVLIPIIRPEEVLNLLTTNLSEDNVLKSNALQLIFNKELNASSVVLYENGTRISTHSEQVGNVLYVSCSVGYVSGREYKIVIEMENTSGRGHVKPDEDIVLTFTYEPELVAPEGETPVIYDSIFDPTVERILTSERVAQELAAFLKETQYNPNFTGNAILNPISTDFEVSHWLRPIAPTITAGTYSEIPLGGNYWGTVNETAIGLQMVDYTDFISYARLMYAPYLTEAPENTFPFVTSVTLWNKNGEQVTTVGNEEITFRVTFNRDMDTSIPLLVRFGSAFPYGDYEIEGRYVNARTWEGVYTLNTLIENGNQYFTISNGCSATDDLELQLDQHRFGFVIDTTAAQALIMQGTALDTGIELKWTQDDFKTLMGYNVYRSTKEDGLYTRLNDVVIPADTMEWFDTTVEPGVVYYYNFTVVQTDLTESEPSGKIVIMSRDTMAPDIYHSPVSGAFTGSNLVISATITDNLHIAYANLYYRVTGGEEWTIIRMNKLNDKFSAIIPANAVTLDGIEYYIEAFDGVSFTYKGNAEAPFSVAVQEAIDANALGDVNGDGIITNLDALLLLYAINDKYNLSAEAFARADLNGDGELWAAEALRILQYVSGVVGSVKM